MLELSFNLCSFRLTFAHNGTLLHLIQVHKIQPRQNHHKPRVVCLIPMWVFAELLHTFLMKSVEEVNDDGVPWSTVAGEDTAEEKVINGLTDSAHDGAFFRRGDFSVEVRDSGVLHLVL
jgi:hypothetical protein